MRKLLLSVATFVLSVACASAAVGDDLTSKYLQNADFSQGETVRTGICTYGKDMAANGTTLYGMQAVPAWTATNPSDNTFVNGDDNVDGRAAGIYAIGASSLADITGNAGDNSVELFLGGPGNVSPATNVSGKKEGNALGILSVWGLKAQYTQSVTLPAGTYTLKYDVYNGAGTGDISENYFGFISDDGISYVSDITSFAVGRWQTITVEFQLEETTSGVVSIGYNGPRGSAAMPHLFVDNVRLVEPSADDSSETPTLKAGKYFIQNTESGTFLSSGAYWGTRAVLFGRGIEYDVTVSGDQYTLKSNINGGTKALRPSDGFNDQSGTWQIIPTTGGYYMFNGSQYFCNDASGIPQYKNTPDASCVWRFVTAEQRKALLDDALPSNPVDATVYINAADFLFGDANNSPTWGVGSSGNSDGGSSLLNASNAERWNAGTFTVSQTLTDLPNGTYVVRCQGYTRKSGTQAASADSYESGEVLPAYLIANDEKVPLKSVFAEAATSGFANVVSTSGNVYSIPNSQGEAAAFFSQDKYWNEVEVVVTDGNLTLGVHSDGGIEWVVFDSFRLSYYGSFQTADRTTLDKMIAIYEAKLPNPNAVACDADVRQQYIEALDAAKQEESDFEGATTTLADAFKAISQSIAQYEGVQAQLVTVQNIKNSVQENGWSKLAEEIDAYYSTISNHYQNGTLADSEMDGITDHVRILVRDYVSKYSLVGTEETGIDMTDRIVNPLFIDAGGKGWPRQYNIKSMHGGFEEFPCAEIFNKPFEIYQDIEGLQNGLYKVTVNSFYRPGEFGTFDGTESVPVQLMLNDFYTPVQHIYSDPLPDASAHDQFNCYLTDYTQNPNNFYTYASGSNNPDHHFAAGYVPNGMTGASVAFLAGRYKQTVYGLVEDGKLRLGLTSMDKQAHWCLWSNFRLYYMEKDSTALDAVLRNYIERAELMIDTINCDNKNIVIRSLQNGIEKATTALGKDADIMYEALNNLNGCIKNYIDNLEAFVLRMRELDELYDSADKLAKTEYYSGSDTFQALLKEVSDYAANGYLSPDVSIADIDYLVDMIGKLTKGINTYRASAAIAFPTEIATLNGATPSAKGYTVSESHITSVDISGCGLQAFPTELLTLPRLTSINAAHNSITDVDFMKEALSAGKTINLQFQDIDQTIDLHAEDLADFEAVFAKAPKLPYYDAASDSYLKGGNALNVSTQRPDASDKQNWTMQVTYDNGGSPVVQGLNNADNSYRGQSGDLLYITYPKASNSVSGSFYRARFYFNPGDVNFENGTDATDLQATILYAFGDYRTRPFNFTAADTYTDGMINVQDVICTVNLLLDADIASEVKLNRNNVKNRQPEADDAQAYVYISDGKLYLHSTVPVATLSIKATGDVCWQIEHMGMMQTTQKANVVAYAFDGTTLPCNEDVLLGECSQLSIHSISLSDEEACPISVRLSDGNTTGINLSSTSGQDEAIYDLFGRKINHTKRGVNIVRSNGTIRKIYK